MVNYTPILSTKQVAIIPTDTLYGLVALASDEDAVARLYRLKNREGQPGTLIAASIDQFVQLGLKKRYLTAVEQYWPGAVSVIIPAGNELNYLHQGKNSLAVRIPDVKELREYLESTGPLLTSSANLHNQPPANNLDEARAYFGNKVDFYIDGGDMSGNAPSTVLRVIDDAVEVLREGAVKIAGQD